MLRVDIHMLICGDRVGMGTCCGDGDRSDGDGVGWVQRLWGWVLFPRGRAGRESTKQTDRETDQQTQTDRPRVRKACLDLSKTRTWRPTFLFMM